MTHLGAVGAGDQGFEVDPGLAEQLLERLGAAEHPVLEPDLGILALTAQLLDLVLEPCDVPAQADLDLALGVALLARGREPLLGAVQAPRKSDRSVSTSCSCSWSPESDW